MKWLLLGAHGQLGQSLQRVLRQQEIEYRACSHFDVDITDIESVKTVVEKEKPRIVVNLAAWTDVDGAESHHREAFLINAVGAENVAKVSAQFSIPLIHISTDYVFDGKQSHPYKVSDLTHPLSTYGKSKRDGELLVQMAHPDGAWIVRTAWLYSPFGKNFAKSILKKALQHEPISVVSDVFGQPTSAIALAQQLVMMVVQKLPFGIYHGTNSGIATWYEFAHALTRPMELVKPIVPVPSTTFPTIALRPQYSVLDHSQWGRVGAMPMPPWEESLIEMWPELLSSVRENYL